MKYYNFFRSQIQTNGFPRLNKAQSQRLIDVLVMEARVNSLNEKDRSNPEIMNDYYREIRSLNELTRRRPPGELLRQMIKISLQSPD